MSGLEAIAAIGAQASSASDAASRVAGNLPVLQAAPVGGAGFGEILATGMRAVEQKLANANDLVRSFAVDDSIPLHQVTFALEEARLSVELAMQVRSRLVESYRELMNMQI